MTTDSPVQLSCAQTATLVRQDLRARFPGVAFSVRSRRYAGGASVDVAWTDGPTWLAVQSVCDRFESAGFDGSIDLQYGKVHWLLPDGSVQLAHTSGTQGSGGVHPAQSQPRPAGARLCRFGAHYVQAQRHYSGTFLRSVAERVARQYQSPTPTVHDEPHGAWIERGGPPVRPHSYESLGDLVLQVCAATEAS